MKTFVFLSLLSIVLLISSVSAYYCIYEGDKEQVKELKQKINTLALKHDIEINNLSKEQVILKLKYFSPCR